MRPIEDLGSTGLGKPTSADYSHTGQLRRKISKYSGDDFKPSFDEFASSNGQSINMRHVHDIVVNTLGADTPQWVIDKFLLLSDKVASFQILTWSQFR